MQAKRIDFHPNRTAGVFLSGLCVTAAVALIWVGRSLVPADAEAIDGVHRLLFLVIPIRLFSWLSAAVFLLIACLIGKRSFRRQATLSVSEQNGLTLSGQLLPWSSIEGIRASENELIITLRTENLPDGLGRAATRPLSVRNRQAKSSPQIVLSSLALGADPAAAAAAIREANPTAGTAHDVS